MALGWALGWGLGWGLGIGREEKRDESGRKEKRDESVRKEKRDESVPGRRGKRKKSSCGVKVVEEGGEEDS
eukprot:scaffold26740_cov89-Skeletonema_menzelii.AAC.1